MAQTQEQQEQEFAKELQEANLSVYQDAEKAVEISAFVYKNAKNTSTKITALVTLVNAYTALNQSGEALKYATETFELAKTSENIQYKIWALGLLGEQYQVSHLNGISREYLDSAEVLIQNSNLSEEGMAVSRGNIFAIKGNGYKDEIDCEYAIKNYDLAIDSYKSIPKYSAARNNLALVFLEKGNCLLELNALNAAEKNFRLTLDIAQKNGLEEYMQRAELGLAMIKSREGDFTNSKDDAEALLATIDTKLHPKLKNELYLLLRDNYLVLGAMEKYNFYNQKYEKSAREITDLEKHQFQQVLQFVEQKPTPATNNIGIENILLYSLLLLSTAIAFWELFQWARKR
ncbi:hypothetical protein [Aequorivita capsosiphonis]|uniref:hypothetical protein n=1 Tax=Aequorivita capsosiphonis TaxID=487317 RepID=UPI0012FB8C50|nr:hypothetical protein [Aequorivita capsosiphonis]